VIGEIKQTNHGKSVNDGYEKKKPKSIYPSLGKKVV